MAARHASMRSGPSHRRAASQATSSRDSYLDDDLLGEQTGRYSPVSVTSPAYSDYAGPERAATDFDFDDSDATLVIAIDYGTTNTGVAWSYMSATRADLNLITPIRRWAAAEDGAMSNTSKVPSVYSYSPAIDGALQWGASLSGTAVTMINTKLELDKMSRLRDELELTLQLLDHTKDLSFEHVKRTGDDPEYTWKSPELIVADYMHKIFEVVYPQVGRFSKDQILRERTPVDLVITVPVNWSYEARNATLRAIAQAGFNEKAFPLLRNNILITEAEAAALYTARYYQERSQEFLKVGECFILCDAGGGTVDCVSYQVVQLEPLELKKVTTATSEKCGATYINENFKRWLRAVIGDTRYRHLDANITDHQQSTQSSESGPLRYLMMKFEEEKRRYPHANQSPAIKLALPRPLNKLTIPGKVKEGDVSVPIEQMKRFFDPCVSRVIALILGQKEQIASKANRRTKNVFLVGGFGSSLYLRQQLETSLARRGLILRRPDEDTSWTAVVCGAAMYGVERSQHTKTLRLMHQSVRSYGIVVHEAAPIWKFDEGDHYIDASTNTVMVADQFAWLVRKGDLIMSDEPTVCEKEFTVTSQGQAMRTFDLPVYKYPGDDEELDDELDNLPDRWETSKHEVKDVTTVKCNLAKFSSEEFRQFHDQTTGQTTYTANLVCKMRMTLKEMQVEVFFNNISIGLTKVKVDHTRPDTHDIY